MADCEKKFWYEYIKPVYAGIPVADAGDFESLVRKANYPGPTTNFLVQACAAELQEKVILAEMRKHGLRLDMTMTEERYQFFMRRVEGWRPIGRQRARKLRRRGEDVRYLHEFGSNAWIPPHLRDDRSL